jgi:hypothetical protein
MQTQTTIQDQRGAVLVQMHNASAALDELYIKQREWLDTQETIATAFNFLSDHGYTVTPRPVYSWASSPHAARIAELEKLLGV